MIAVQYMEFTVGHLSFSVQLHYFAYVDLNVDIAAKPPSILELSEALKQLVNSPLFSDVKFLVAGEEVLAHRAILSVRSAYFRALLSNGMLESMPLESNKVSFEFLASKSDILKLLEISDFY